MAKSGGGSGSWLMTYADFITLMMIFFIVLYTLTPGVEQNKWEAVVGAFQGKRSVLYFDSIVVNETQRIEVQRAENWDQLYKRIQREDLQHDMEIKLIPEGVQIIMGEGVLFETYSVVIKEEGWSILNDIVDGINNYTFEEVSDIEIEGHTDNRPVIVNGVRKYESNWELGSGRALSVLKFLSDRTVISDEYYSITSYGEHKPIAPNDTQENMRKNRRVEIYIKYSPPSENENKIPGINS
ncbi:MAG: flagellar motor protein MotB [Balneolaceae bacterium]